MRSIFRSVLALLLLAAIALAQSAVSGPLIITQAGRGTPAPPVGGGGSDLEELVSGMSSNSWATFTMGGLTAAIFTATSTGADKSCAEYASRMVWDPLHNQLFFAGTSHTGGTNLAGSGCGSTWDETTNTWTRETYTWNSDSDGHGYAHLTIDPATGNAYRRGFNDREIKRREYGDTGQASWETGHVTDIGGDYFNAPSGGLEWYPELNSGSGGLVFVDVAGANWTNSALSSWSTQSGNSFSGGLDNNIAYAGGFIYWGSGNGDTELYRLGPTGTVTQMTDFPFDVGTNVGGGAMIAAPDGVGLVILENADNGDFRYFNGSTWSDLGSHQMSEDEYFLCGTIQERGAIICVSIDSAGTATPTAKVYKQ